MRGRRARRLRASTRTASRWSSSYLHSSRSAPPCFGARHSWNAERPNLGPRTLLGIGIGGRFGFTHRAILDIYWGRDLKQLKTAGGMAGVYDLLGDGIHPGLSPEWP